jgi:hypothetical protein
MVNKVYLSIFRLSSKFECNDIHHKDCVFTDMIYRDELVNSLFGNISYTMSKDLHHLKFSRGQYEKERDEKVYTVVFK